MTLVSIIIPAYNAGRFLDETIQSCLNQTYSDIEIIVVDDGSTDNTRVIVEKYPDVIYIRQDNAGPARARNTGMHHAKGAYLQFLDADDFLLPEKLERSMRVFEAYPNTDVVYTKYEWRTEDLSDVADASKQVGVVPPGDELKFMLEKGITLFGNQSGLVRAEVARKTGGFDERLIITEDLHFWMKVANLGVTFRYIDETLAWYRRVGGSLSSLRLKMSLNRLKAYQLLREEGIPEQYDLEEKIAHRHHVYAMNLWENGDRDEARAQFREAIRLSKNRHLLWRLMILATYFMDADTVGTGIQKLSNLRRNF